MKEEQQSINRTRPVVHALDQRSADESNASTAPLPDAATALGLVRSMTGPAMERPDFTMVKRAIEHRVHQQDEDERKEITQATMQTVTQIDGLLPKEPKEEDDAWL